MPTKGVKFRKRKAQILSSFLERLPRAYFISIVSMDVMLNYTVEYTNRQNWNIIVNYYILGSTAQCAAANTQDEQNVAFQCKCLKF